MSVLSWEDFEAIGDRLSDDATGDRTIAEALEQYAAQTVEYEALEAFLNRVVGNGAAMIGRRDPREVLAQVVSFALCCGMEAERARAFAEQFAD